MGSRWRVWGVLVAVVVAAGGDRRRKGRERGLRKRGWEEQKQLR